MVQLTDLQKSQCRFHLGYHSGIPAGDRARLEKAMATVPDNWTRTRIGDILARCETAFNLTELPAGSLNTNEQVAISGDVMRTTDTKARESWATRQRFYLAETDNLALTLGVRNYRNPQQAINGYLQFGGTFINSIPGPAGDAGTVWHTLAGVPTNGQFNEIVGDFALDTDTGDLYKKVDATTWTFQLNLRGVAGATWHTGSGVPTDGQFTEAVDDLYLDSATGDYYQKTNATTWTLQGNLEGPKGDTGNDGQSIDHVSLTSQAGNTKTYTVWGDAGETIDLGSYTLSDGTTGSVTSAGAIELVHQSSVGAVDPGETWLYAKTDGKLYFKPDGGTETEVGAGAGGGGREVLTANRTYYVDATNGSDSNDGLSSGTGAFATIQKAFNVVGVLDISIYDVVIELAADTYTNIALEPLQPVGVGSVTLRGDTSNTNQTNYVLQSEVGTNTPPVVFIAGWFSVALTFEGVTFEIDDNHNAFELNAGKVNLKDCRLKRLSNPGVGTSLKLTNATCLPLSTITFEGSVSFAVNCGFNAVYFATGVQHIGVNYSDSTAFFLGRLGGMGDARNQTPSGITMTSDVDIYSFFRI